MRCSIRVHTIRVGLLPTESGLDSAISSLYEVDRLASVTRRARKDHDTTIGIRSIRRLGLILRITVQNHRNGRIRRGVSDQAEEELNQSQLSAKISRLATEDFSDPDYG